MDSKAQAEKGVNIGIGEYRMDSSLLTSIGLGSCVAVVIHDNRKNVGAVAHVMLPDSNGRNDRPGKFADTAVPTLYNLLIDGGSNKRDLIAKIAGGSSMFKQFKGNLDIGQRNVRQLKRHWPRYMLFLLPKMSEAHADVPSYTILPKVRRFT